MLCSNSTLSLAGQRTDSYWLFCLSLKNSTSLFISNYFPTKAALGKGGDGTPIRDGKHLELCKTGREKKPVYNRTALILPLHRESRSRLQGEQSLLLAYCIKGGETTRSSTSKTESPLPCTPRIYPVLS